MEAKVQPHSEEIECAVIGILLTQPDAWNKCIDLLQPEVFYSEANRQIYRVGRELWVASKPVDTLTVLQRLKSDGLLDTIGGGYYLSQLSTRAGVSSNIEYHCRLLIEFHISRRLIAIGNGVVTDAYGTADALELLDNVSSSVSDLYNFTQSTNLASAADNITDLTDGKPGTFYTFGIPELDALGTFQAGLPHVFAGRPGIGKSIVSVHVMWHLTQLGNVLLFSPEMTVRQVQARIVSSECGVPYSTILRQQMNEQDRETVAQCIMRIGDRLDKMKIDPTSGITPAQIRARCERAMKMDGILAFGVDHLHKMSTGDRRSDREETSRISQCMEGITEVAKNTNLPAFVACQLNREVEKRTDKRPKLSDLKQTGKIEEDAAMVGLLYREGYYSEHPPYDDTMEFSVAKNRDGSTGLAKCPITPALNRIGFAPGSPFATFDVTGPFRNQDAITEKAPF